MKVIIRADASHAIGAGHIMRCLALAEVLKESGESVKFVSRAHCGNFIGLVEDKGFKVYSLPAACNVSLQKELKGYDKWLSVEQETDASETIKVLEDEEADWIVIDHYALDNVWERMLRPHVKRIMVIDDLANRRHDCDMLLDQTYCRQKSEYHGQVPESCRLLLGSSFALLRPEFSRLRLSALRRRENYQTIQRIMISMGGMDEGNITPKALNAISRVAWHSMPTVSVILTSAAPYLRSVIELTEKYDFHIDVLTDVNTMAEQMLEADLAIGSGGTTSWERCCMALPTILVVLEANQHTIGKNLGRAGATITLQEDSQLEVNMQRALEELDINEPRYMALSKNASRICDGEGTSRVVQEVLSG